MGEMADYYIEQHLAAFPDGNLFARRTKPVVRNKTSVWKTREGKLLYIDTMEESHMINCVKMCIRNNKTPPARMLERLKEAEITFDVIVNHKGKLT